MVFRSIYFTFINSRVVITLLNKTSYTHTLEATCNYDIIITIYTLSLVTSFLTKYKVSAFHFELLYNCPKILW